VHARTSASAISRVERSTPPDSSAGSNCTTVSLRTVGRRARWSVDKHEVGAAIRALALPAFGFDRQVNARMRVPQCHRRQRTAQRQVGTTDFVSRLRIGGRGSSGRCGFGHVAALLDAGRQFTSPRVRGLRVQPGRSNSRISAGASPLPRRCRTAASSAKPSASPAASVRPSISALPRATCSQ